MTSAAALVGRFHLLIPAAEAVMETATGHRRLAKPAGSSHGSPRFEEEEPVPHQSTNPMHSFVGFLGGHLLRDFSP
jgi:hypothetical protein